MPYTNRHKNPESLVIVFAKAPLPGMAKTRLIPLLGAEGAAALHAQLIRRTLTTATQARVGPVELHAPEVEHAFLRECSKTFHAPLAVQHGNDLGARMQHAFDRGLERYPRVIMIGCDCPPLATQHLHDAQSALENGNDVVLIPAEDGGYALIGLTRCDARLFGNMMWGTNNVLAATRARLQQLGWRWHELETLWDIDRPEDYARWLALEENRARSLA